MWQIVFFTDHRGKSPPLEFIESLPPPDQARIRNSLRLLEEFGPTLGMPHARPLREGVWELRPGGIRLFYFAFIRKQYVVLNGYRKQSPKAPALEVETALRRMKVLMDEV